MKRVFTFLSIVLLVASLSLPVRAGDTELPGTPTANSDTELPGVDMLLISLSLIF